jgi:D-cysteine desulfhydrase family pyridoxal phosphate-dependent enzyme
MDDAQELRNRLAAYPRVGLTHLPTPLERLESEPPGLGDTNVFLKRDDQTGLAFGGNKARKLEFIIADVKARGADTVVTWAGLQSNWCRQTAAAAAREGLKPVLVLLKKPGAAEEYDGNLLLDHLCGATIHVVDLEPNRGFLELADVSDLVEPVVAGLKAAGRKPYLAPVGGSLCEGSMTKPLGAMGYVDAFLELHDQAASLGISLDAVVHASGSAGTQAGLLAAAKAVSPRTRIVGVSVALDRETLGRYVRSIVDDLCRELEITAGIEDDDIIVFDDFLGEGYGVLTPEISRAIAGLARSEGVLLDPVYTGKTWTGMTNLIERGFIRSGENVVFLHTGGTPALFPYRAQLLGFLEGDGADSP